MKIPDPIIIGYPAIGEPDILGELHDHGLASDILLGSSVFINGKRLVVNVSYVPTNPKKDVLITLLVPKENLDDSFWINGAVKSVESCKRSEKKEEFPF